MKLLESLREPASIAASPSPHGLGVFGGKRGRLRDASVSLAFLALTACATKPAEPVIRTVEVKVPVTRSCIPPNYRDPPAFPDTDDAIRSSPGPGDLLQLLAAGRLLRNQWIREAAPVLAGCR